MKKVLLSLLLLNVGTVVLAQVQFLPNINTPLRSSTFSDETKNPTDSQDIQSQSLLQISLGEKTATEVTIPVQRQLSIVLSQQGWVLNTVSSNLTGGDDKSIVLRTLRETEKATTFLFTRDSVGTNLLFFERNNLENSEIYTYNVSVNWIDNNQETGLNILQDENSVVASLPRDDSFVYTPPNTSTTTQLLQNTTDSVALPTQEEQQTETQRVVPNNTTTQDDSTTETTPLSTNDIGIVINDIEEIADVSTSTDTSVDTNTDTGLEIITEDIPVVSGEETDEEVLDNIDIEDENTPMTQDGLEAIKGLFDQQDYKLAQDKLEEWLTDNKISDLETADALFEIAQILEKKPKDIKDIELAISFYQRIIENYPISPHFYEAIENMLFLQKQYISIR